MSNFKATDGDEEEIPPLADLLVSLSTTARNTSGQRDIELRNTLKALIARETLDGVPKGEYARLAILLAFKRRNHSKARASGDGDGERGILREILWELYSLVDEADGNSILADLVHVVLPLVPHYGSWRDLLVLGEGSFREVKEEKDDDKEEDEEKAPLELPPLGQAVGRVFATQLRHDMAAVIENEGREDAQPPSNACKYAPHEKRHTGNTKVKEGRERAKKSNKLLRANRIQRLLADEVAALVLAEDGTTRQQNNPRLRADYRKFLSKLKAILTAKGFVIESLLCKRNLQAINFNRANKGSLAKNRKCLEKDPAVKAKWTKAMMSSSNAVPDMDSLLEAAVNITEEHKTVPDPADRMSSLRVMKCIESFQASRAEMQASAEALMEQVMESGEEIDTRVLSASMAVTVIPVVDSGACETKEEFISLVLAAYVSARSQGLSYIVVDGEILSLPPIPTSAHATSSTAVTNAADEARARRADALALREVEALATSMFFESVCTLATSVFDRGNDDEEMDVSTDQADRIRQTRALPHMERLHLNTEKALNSHIGGDGGDEKEDQPVDVIYLTSCDLSRDVDAEGYQHLMESLQNSCSSPLRSLSFCRVFEPHIIAESPCPFVLRSLPSHPNPSELSLDLCLLMDLTASMGSWMDASKKHLTDIVSSLQKETKVKNIRVSYVGYRDWQDDGRLVRHDFVPIADAEHTVLALMDEQEPDGGADMEEDVLIAFHAALTDLTWQSDMRIMLHMADAPAHGYGGWGDRFEDGRCPDQKGAHLSLEETLSKLAYDKNMDLLFCRLDEFGNSNAKMEKMFSGVYGGGPGFGILPMADGASKFRDAILSTLSSSMLQALAPPDIEGLQSFSGGTASALLRVINSSLRESISAVGATLLGDDENKEDDGVGVEGISCTMDGDEDDEEEEEVGGAKRSGDISKSPRTTYERLMSELEADELQPVRLALGMSLKQSMQTEAAAVLLAAGVSVQDMINNNYPEDVIQLMKEQGVKKMGQL